MTEKPLQPEARRYAEAARAYTELATIVVSEPLGAVMRRVAELAVRTVPGADDVSVTLVEADRARTVAFAGAIAVDLDERQYHDGFGPCLDAAVTGRLISIDDTSDNLDYPEFCRLARSRGVHRVLAVGIVSRPGVCGALNLYGTGPAEPFTPAAREIAITFSGYAAVTVLNAARYAASSTEVERMRAALESRATIEQAKGIVMAARGCTADEAFDVLRHASSTSNRKLREVARDVIDQVGPAQV